MSREKQIEEIAKILCGMTKGCDECAWDKARCDERKDAENIYNAGCRKQEWISVDERLPEKNVRVLVYIKSNRSYTRFDTDRLDDRGFVRWFNDVTHWMPLPEAPKMKGGAE